MASFLNKAPKELLFIDLSEKPAQAKIVREGHQVPTPKVDATKAGFVLDNLEILAPRVLPRVVSQSIPAGTKVTKGTVVDLVLVPKSSIPFSMFEEVHADLADKTVDTLTDTLLENSRARQILLAHENPADIPTADKEFLTAELVRNGVRVNESDSTRTFNKAFAGARGALAFR